MQQAYNSRILALNIKRCLSLAKIIVTISIFLGLLNIVARLFYPSPRPYYIGYLWVYTALVVINIAYSWYFKKYPHVSEKIRVRMMASYIGMMLLIGAIITYIDEYMYGHLLMFMLFYFLCSMLFITKLRYMLPYTLIVSLIVLKGVYDSPIIASSSRLYIIFMISIVCIGITMQVRVGRSQRTVIFQQLQLEIESTRSKKLAQQLAHSNERLAAANEQLTKMAMYDALTHLPNRYAFLQHIKQAADAHQTTHCAIFIVDIDYFKQYNDFYGHPQGDIVLKRVAETLSTIGTEQAIYFARWGGEEFIGVTIGDVTKADAQCQQIVDHIEALRIEHALSINGFLTASVGSYAGTLSADTPFEHFYKEADKMLYDMKQQGRNGYRLKKEIFTNV